MIQSRENFVTDGRKDTRTDGQTSVERAKISHYLYTTYQIVRFILQFLSHENVLSNLHYSPLGYLQNLTKHFSSQSA